MSKRSVSILFIIIGFFLLGLTFFFSGSNVILAFIKEHGVRFLFPFSLSFLTELELFFLLGFSATRCHVQIVIPCRVIYVDRS